MSDLVSLARSRLEALRDPERAAAMASYMKTDMPFYGVPAPQRAVILGELLAAHRAGTRSAYVDAVSDLWRLPHREEKYLAIDYARADRRFITLSSVPLYRRLIVEGAWWDLVDPVATGLVGVVLLNQRERMTPTIRKWSSSPNLWLRRTAVIAQLGHREATDQALLFDVCQRLAAETDFFVRKAIGWALRDHSKTYPDAVRRFLDSHGDRLAGLSRREAAKYL